MFRKNYPIDSFLQIDRAAIHIEHSSCRPRCNRLFLDKELHNDSVYDSKLEYFSYNILILPRGSIISTLPISL